MRGLTWYTDTPGSSKYRRAAETLREDIARSGLIPNVLQIDWDPSWPGPREACRAKPRALLTLMDSIPEGKSAWFFDADSRLLKSPSQIEDPPQLGLVFNVLQAERIPKPKDPYLWATYAMYVRNTPDVRHFLRKWDTACQTARANTGDHQFFRRLVESSELNTRDVSEHLSGCLIFKSSRQGQTLVQSDTPDNFKEMLRDE